MSNIADFFINDLNWDTDAVFSFNDFVKGFWIVALRMKGQNSKDHLEQNVFVNFLWVIVKYFDGSGVSLGHIFEPILKLELIYNL